MHRGMLLIGAPPSGSSKAGIGTAERVGGTFPLALVIALVNLRIG